MRKRYVKLINWEHVIVNESTSLAIVDNEIVDGSYHIVDNNYNDERVKAMFIGTKRSDNTKATYRNSIAMLESFLNKPMSNVTIEDSIAYLDYLKERYSSLHSIKLHTNVAKAYYGFALSLNYIRSNPFAPVKPDTPSEVTHNRIIDSEDVIKLINAPKDDYHKVMLRLLYVSGMRVSELTSIKWSDINSDGVLRIVGKGQKERFVTLSEKTLQALYAIKGDANADDRLFPVSRVAVHRYIKRAAKRAGITGDVSAHWLRHAHASHALDAGANLVDVRDTLGHSSIATTNKYLHGKRQNSSSLRLGL